VDVLQGTCQAHKMDAEVNSVLDASGRIAEGARMAMVDGEVDRVMYRWVIGKTEAGPCQAGKDRFGFCYNNAQEAEAIISYPVSCEKIAVKSDGTVEVWPEAICLVVTQCTGKFIKIGRKRGARHAN
jgi:hypothetical protein